LISSFVSFSFSLAKDVQFDSNRKNLYSVVMSFVFFNDNKKNQRSKDVRKFALAKRLHSESLKKIFARLEWSLSVCLQFEACSRNRYNQSKRFKRMSRYCSDRQNKFRQAKFDSRIVRQLLYKNGLIHRNLSRLSASRLMKKVSESKPWKIIVDSLISNEQQQKMKRLQTSVKNRSYDEDIMCFFVRMKKKMNVRYKKVSTIDRMTVFR
jgi:hypothetical protein